ncbi:MAG: helix-turn-helix domain-containing protein [Sneathiella sp.]
MTRARPYNRDVALDAAMRLFWKKGYHATSLKDLEDALHMKPGSIYAAFSSKEALFSAALERYYRRNKAEFLNGFDGDVSPLGKMVDYLRYLGQNPAEDPECRACMLVKTLLSATPEDDAIADQARGYLDELKGDFATVFDSAKAAGELPADLDVKRLARRYQSEVMTLRIEAHRGTNGEDLADLADEAAQRFEQLRV